MPPDSCGWVFLYSDRNKINKSREKFNKNNNYITWCNNKDCFAVNCDSIKC